MTTKEAYEILYKATGALALDRANHEVLEQALAIAKEAMCEPPPKESGQ